MKRFLAVLGALFLILLLAIVGFVAYAAHQGQQLDASSKAYVEANVPLILSTWSKEEFLKRASPQLRAAVAPKPEDLEQVFRKLSKLGALRTFKDIKGDSNASYTTQYGKVITASYTAAASFESGEAQISVRLIQVSGQWQFLLLNVISPLFLR